MCGISGMFLRKGIIAKQRLNNANSTMKHRGPDGKGYWISNDRKVGLSHVRLSIVDLDNRSGQPFSIDNGKYVITFNGEIYNYLDLKDNLLKKYNIKYRTDSDTEVLIYMYKIFGKECLKYLKGMFSFAIYDSKKNEVFITRDFIGQKPLIYSYDANGFYFGSEIPVLFCLNPDISKELNVSSLQLFLTSDFYHIPQPLTIFKHIHKLDVASYMIIKDGVIMEERKYTKLKKHNVSRKKELDVLYTRLDLMKPSGVKYGAFVSGGIDSALVCNGLKLYSSHDFNTYTIKTSDDDTDLKRSNHVCKKLGLSQNVVDIKRIDFLKTINDIIDINGEPYFDMPSVYADSILNRSRLDNNKVMFNGSGGDELYYGYDNRYFVLFDILTKVRKVLPRFIYDTLGLMFKDKKNILSSNVNTLKYNNILNSSVRSGRLLNLSGLDIDTFKHSLKSLFYRFDELVEYDSYIDMTYMFGLFYQNSHALVIPSDLIGMKNSIEVRSLFLEEDIIKRAYSLPLSSKIYYSKLSKGKKVLRSGLKEYFSTGFLNAPKLGFGTSFDIISHIRVKYYDDIVSKVKNITHRDMFNTDNILLLIADFDKNFVLIMKLYVLELWFEKFIDN